MQKQEQELKGCRVLVVEDEGLIAHDIAKRLESLGHTVVGTVSTAEEAMEAAASAELVLMDIRIDGDRGGGSAGLVIGTVANGRVSCGCCFFCHVASSDG